METDRVPRATRVLHHAAHGPAKILSVQYLRGAAAVAVILFHVFQGRLFGLANVGKYGVDLFFVISGFIMMGLSYNGTVGPGRFMVDRAIRIIPTYWAATFLWLSVNTFGNINSFSSGSDLSRLISSLLFLPSRSPEGMYPTLYLGWTLNYEMFFYLLFAISMFVSRKFRILILGGLLSTFVAAGVYNHDRSDVVAFYTNPIVLEFLAGASLACAFGMDLRRRSLEVCVLATCSISIVLSVGYLLDERLIWGAAAVFMLGVFLLCERYRAIPYVPILLLLGNASYAIYLFQDFGGIVILSAARIFGDHVEQVVFYSFPGGLLRCAAAVAVGVLAHYLIEKPLTRGARQIQILLSRAPARAT